MKIAVVAVLLVGAGLGLAFRESVAGTATMWLWLGAPYLALAAFAVRRFHEDGTLRDLLLPRWGDLSKGVALAGALYGAAWLLRHVLFPGGGTSPRILWLYRLALSVGSTHPTPLLLFVIIVFSILEEIVWRGLVQSELNDALGARYGWLASALAYALADIPTVWLLADPLAGPNPVLIFAAFGCGLVWSFGAFLMGRLSPLVISHAVFSYFALVTLLPRFG